jgi:hypothetical protein
MALERVAEKENVKVTRLAGSDSSVAHHSYMAIRPYRVRLGEPPHQLKSFRESFIKNLVSELVGEMRKMGIDVNYSKDWPYEDGESSGCIRVKTKLGDTPTLAAMIDVRLFVVSDDIAFVNVTFHIMYLNDPDMVPNLLPETKPAPQTNGSQPANGKNSPAGKGVPTNNRGSAPRQPPESQPPAKPGSVP